MLKNKIKPFDNAQFIKLFISLLLVELMFSIHHIYGEYRVYHDGIHILSFYISIAVFVFTIGSLWLAMKKEHSGLKILAISIISLVWIGFVGILEGAGIHLLQNILSLLKIPDATLLMFFPKLPSGDLINELTGLFEFLFAIPLFIHLLHYARSEHLKQTASHTLSGKIK